MVVGQEKGIDVLCALALCRPARTGDYDVVVLASRDTDLAPALDEAASHKRAKIEPVKWYSPNQSFTRGRIKTTVNLWMTSTEEADFGYSLDPNDYRQVSDWPR